MPLSSEVRARINDMIARNHVVLFMKGSRSTPQCGFSATVVGILDDALEDYDTHDVLADPELREGIKEFSEWPTIPQLYVDGEFVGGCDIVRDMAASGQLHTHLGVTLEVVEPPSITLTAAAAAAIGEALADTDPSEGDTLRLGVSPRYEHSLSFGRAGAADVTVELGTLKVALDRGSARRANGLSIDFVDGPQGKGFKIDNPNAPAAVKQLSPPELRAMMESGDAFELLDVRTSAERDIASLPGSRLLDEEASAALGTADRQAQVVLYCHTGRRSQAAAERLVEEGFTNVHNLAGGIDAWSTQVDDSVPRY